jgi:hypothetical protein
MQKGFPANRLVKQGHYHVEMRCHTGVGIGIGIAEATVASLTMAKSQSEMTSIRQNIMVFGRNEQSKIVRWSEFLFLPAE